MGEEATQVTNLLLTVIRVLTTRLNGMGILLSRDCQTVRLRFYYSILLCYILYFDDFFYHHSHILLLLIGKY